MKLSLPKIFCCLLFLCYILYYGMGLGQESGSAPEKKPVESGQQSLKKPTQEKKAGDTKLLLSEEARAPVDTSTTEIQPTKKKTSSVGIDAPLKYDADVIDIGVNKRVTYLLGNAVVKYKSMTLTAAKITVDWDEQTLTAEGVPDTSFVYTDNPGDSTMQINYRGLPVFSDAGDEMTGFKMVYNYKTEKGRVLRGRTEFEGGRYFGEHIKKVNKKVLNVSDGYYTTCNIPDHPHFHFQSRRMKIILRDKVIAKPVVMYLGNIPVAALPFGIFPHKSGRHSGVIIPRYGESAREGRYIRELGYYWAPSDYFDARATVDFFDKTGWMLRSDLNYAVRYTLRGRLSGSLTRKNFVGGYNQRRWDMRIQHNQTIDPTMSLNVNGTFVSDASFYKDLSSNLNERLNRELRSNATLSKSWPGTKNSLTINIRQVRDLETGQVTLTFPQLSFRHGQSAIFGTKETTSRTRGRRSEEKENLKWYHYLYYSYNSGLVNTVRKGGTQPEHLTRRIDHNLNFTLSSPKKYFGWLGLNQSLRYQEKWYDRYKKFSLDVETNSVKTDTVIGFAAQRTFGYSASANTKIYGLFKPNIGSVKAIRHVVTPFVSFSYRPDFTDPKWGYVEVLVDTAGKEIKKDRFMEPTPRGKQKQLSFSLQNLFQMKIGEGDKEKKFDLFTLNFNSGYNFEAKEFKLSNLSSSLRANPSQNLSVTLSSSHSFYKYDSEQKKRINKLLFMEGHFPRLTNFRLNVSLRLQGKRTTRPGGEGKGIEGSEKATSGETNLGEEELFEGGQGDRFEAEDSFSGLNIPWSASLTFNFDLNKNNPQRPIKRYYLNIGRMEVQLTRNWKISYRARFDLKEKKVVNHSFTFYRDLHCWEARFRWVPSGIGKEFYLRISIKAPQLRDIKIEKRGGRASVLGY